MRGAGGARHPTSLSSSTSALRTTPTASTPLARPSAPTAGSIAASSGIGENGPRAPGGVRDRPGRRPRGPAARVGAGRLRGRRRRARDRRHPGARQGGDARGAGDHRAAAARGGAQAPARNRRGRRPARRASPSASTSSTAPSRPAWPATAWPSPPTPSSRFRLDLRKAGWEGDRDPLVEGCPCPACQHHDRDYISYLSRAEELTAVRLICLHNLTYMHQLTTHARTAIAAGSFTSYAATSSPDALPGRPDKRGRGPPARRSLFAQTTRQEPARARRKSQRAEDPRHLPAPSRSRSTEIS